MTHWKTNKKGKHYKEKPKVTVEELVKNQEELDKEDFGADESFREGREERHNDKSDTQFSIGDRVKVEPGNDNEYYDSFRNKILIVTHVATSRAEHGGYDEGVAPDALYDFETLDGEKIPVSLYDYELVSA